MLTIGRVLLGAVPRVVLVVDRPGPWLRTAIRQGVDILEARVDRFRHRSPQAVVDAVRAMRRLGVPVIGTVRSHAEGGAVALTDGQRVALYTALAPAVDAMDVELRAEGVREAVLALCRRHHRMAILSYHDFHRTPTGPQLNRLLQRAHALGADVTKIAVTPRSSRDVVRLLQWTARHRRRRIVTIALGPRGSVSRVVFPAAGSLWTYTSRTPSDGQLPLRALRSGLRRLLPSRR